jgi:spore coat polysaccharide biosynthesis protein SpsF (cytidylyltransferase family)
MKIVAITQARYGSSRLPGKVLKKINGITLLETHLKRALQSKLITKLMVATTREVEADEIVAIAAKCGVSYYQGSTNDVLDRYYQTAKPEQPDYVVRITSDCPLIDSAIIDKVIKYCIEQKVDYVSNTLKSTFPDGMDVEVFKFNALEKAWHEATLTSDREHVTPYIWRNSGFFNQSVFTSLNYSGEEDFSLYRLTIDRQVDFDLIKHLIEVVGDNKSWMDYVVYLKNNPNIFEINSTVKRNEGYTK